MSKIDAKLAVASSNDSEVSRLHALRESLKGEISELEVIITGKAQLEESLALLNKHKTNDFRTSMLMKWSRPGAAGGGGLGGDGEDGAGAVGSGGYSPRTLAKKQTELKQLQQDKKAMASEYRTHYDRRHARRPVDGAPADTSSDRHPAGCATATTSSSRLSSRRHAWMRRWTTTRTSPRHSRS